MTQRGYTSRQSRFASIPGPPISRSVFNRSNRHITTFDAGLLVPIDVDEVLPGDSFSMDFMCFGRISTLLFPLMDNLYLDNHWFFVPNRLIWENWEKFNGAQDDPGDSTDFEIPQIVSPAGGHGEQSIYDYMGIPPDVEGLFHSALPLRAYNLIYNEWFRDENLVDSLDVPKGDGPDNDSLYAVRRRGKRHDYFTSCLPFRQKGQEVTFNFGTTAPVTGTIGGQGNAVGLESAGGATWTGGLSGTSGQNFVFFSPNWPAITAGVNWGANPGLTLTNATADLSSVSALSVNDLRDAVQTQKLLERDARGGTRYTEVVRAHFGVISPDARLQRPEYLGGGSVPLNVMSVPNTAGGASPQAELAAYGTVANMGTKWNKTFTEHGYIIGLVSVRADLTYQQGLERFWSRLGRYDFYWPVFAHLGEQAVLNKEIFAQGSADSAADAATFGFQARYDEYRYKPSRVSGKFRSVSPTSLDAWHLAQEFATLPVLDQTFIEENPPVDRVVATPTEPHMIVDAFMDYKCARPMPTYSVPGLVDHF